MSYEYDQYLQQHRNNVKRGFEWLLTNLPTVLTGQPDASWQIIFDHDSSKNNDDEYLAYDTYFYGNNRSYEVMEEFKRAWLRHIHRNPHHWQYWVLINDDPSEGEIILDMPYNYIIEMICDWWSFSWQKGDLGEIFNWYDEHSDYIKLSPKTRKTVEDILEQLRERLGLTTSDTFANERLGVNYEVLANIYKSRKNHKLDEWRIFCDWIKELPYSELITEQSERDER